MAVVRARIEKAPIVLASATPSIETRVNAEQGRYCWLKLDSRFGARTLPDLSAIDLRREGPPRGRWLAPRLIAGIEAGLAAGEQSLVIPQPARLCAADALPRLRPSLPMSELLGLAGRASLPQGAGLPSLRPCRAPAGHLPGLLGGRQSHGLRPRRRARRRRGRGAVPECAPAGPFLGYARRARADARATGCGRARRV